MERLHGLLNNNRVVLVTGATGGIGGALVEALYARGRHTVIAACRRPERLVPVVDRLRDRYPDAGSEVIRFALDLNSFAEVDTALERLRSLGLPLDALINNAGTMPLRELTVSPDGYEHTMQVNCLSTLRFTLGVLPLLRSGGSVVMTTSVTRSMPRAAVDFDRRNLSARSVAARFINYGRSKQVLTFASCLLAERFVHSGIRVNCADPGVVDSGIITLGFPVIDRLADILFRPFISTPEQGAKAALRAMDAMVSPSVSTKRRTKVIQLDDCSRAVAERALLLVE